MILAAVDQLFLASLDDDTFGFAQVSITDMLTHLQTTRGTITYADLEANCTSIATLWSPADPIVLLWELSVKSNTLPLSETTLSPTRPFLI